MPLWRPGDLVPRLTRPSPHGPRLTHEPWEHGSSLQVRVRMFVLEKQALSSGLCRHQPALLSAPRSRFLFLLCAQEWNPRA